jgi:hypothetical protein
MTYLGCLNPQHFLLCLSSFASKVLILPHVGSIKIGEQNTGLIGVDILYPQKGR